MSRRAGAWASLCAGSAVLLGAMAASANGRFPAAGQVLVDPADPAHLVVRATYGILSTTDGGERWSWTCEQAVGYGGYQDPAMAFTKDGSLVAGVVDGLSVSHDGGCDWKFIGGDLEKRYVLDVAAEKVDPSSAVLIDIVDDGAGSSATQLWETKDNAATWTQAGTTLPQSFFGLTVDVAPSEPSRVYASGRFGPPDYLGALERSDDRGKTWQRFDIPGSNDQNLPYIGAVDPADPDVVYVRLDGDPTDTLIVTRDGGATWKTVFLGTTGNLFAFAVSPDGATVVVGGDKEGVHRAPATTLAFEKVSKVGAKCFQWTAAGLYACADEFRDGFTLGLSTDQGATFTPKMHLQKLCGPLDCPATTSVGKACPSEWGKIKLTLKTEACDAEPGPDAGTAGAGAGGTNIGGCNCDAGGSAPAGAVAIAAIAAVLGALRRRRSSRWAARGPNPLRCAKSSEKTRPRRAVRGSDR